MTWHDKIKTIITIIIVKNIRDLLWNRHVWCSLNTIYEAFLAPCIRCTDHLYDTCALRDINQHFIPSLPPMISKCWFIVTSSTHEPAAGNCDVAMTDCSRGVSMDLLSDIWNCALRRECRERFPRHQLQRKTLVSDLGMHHGTCVTHVPWCTSGSLTRSGGENVPGNPGACATRNFAYLV